MRRVVSEPRHDWQQRMENIGFVFHSQDGVYWNESACYQFDSTEIDIIESATEELHTLCLEAVEHIVQTDRWSDLRIPKAWTHYVKASWEREDPSLLGRFDLSYDGQHPPKLLEYNADTPTSLLEAAVAQWFWLQDTRPEADQFNSLHESLIERWKQIDKDLSPGQTLHFSSVRQHAEDWATIEYLRDTALQADLKTKFIHIEDIGLVNDETFVDLDEEPITAIFKLYPWEWLRVEAFGSALLRSAMRLLEPPWKMLLSNKALLPILWELFPDHPNLLPAYFDPTQFKGQYVAKPVFSREGANIEMHDCGTVIRSPIASYGKEGYVYQGLAKLPNFDGRYPVVGSWIIGDAPAGMGIREDSSLISTNRSQFIPHYFD